MNLQDILFKKAQKQELAHFYILEGASTEELEQFVQNFIRDYYQKIEGHKQSLAHLMDHPDVFVLGNLTTGEEVSDKFFTVEESEHLARFFEFKPVQGKRKFAVITESHRINSIVANKWLKLLEEPPGLSTIFLLNPRGGRLLDTIHSRALHLKLDQKKTPSDFAHWNEFLTFAKTSSLSQFLDEYSKGEFPLEFWLNELVQWEAQNEKGAEAKIALQEWLKSYREMDTFHQPTATKWTLFYSFLHSHVIPRSS